MNRSRLMSYICIVFGGGIALYAKATDAQNQYVLIGGIMLLMFGVYSLSRNIPSKAINEDEVIEENDEV